MKPSASCGTSAPAAGTPSRPPKTRAVALARGMRAACAPLSAACAMAGVLAALLRRLWRGRDASAARVSAPRVLLSPSPSPSPTTTGRMHDSAHMHDAAALAQVLSAFGKA
jgi:putative intracellular protease/amidase